MSVSGSSFKATRVTPKCVPVATVAPEPAAETATNSTTEASWMNDKDFSESPQKEQVRFQHRDTTTKDETA